MATKEARSRAQAKYDKTHTKGIYLKLNKETDADIIDFLADKENVQGYIKQLIRDDINESVKIELPKSIKRTNLLNRKLTK